MLKISLLFTKNTNFMGELNANSYNKECKIFRVLCLFEFEYMGRFSNLQKYIFKVLLSLKIFFISFILITSVEVFFAWRFYGNIKTQQILPEEIVIIIIIIIITV